MIDENTAVTDANKAEYVQLYVRKRLVEAIAPDMAAFRAGFEDTVRSMSRCS